MANKTLDEIIQLARDEVNEPMPAFFLDDQIMRHFNTAQIDFVKSTGILVKEVDITIDISDKVTIALPVDFLSVKFLAIRTADTGRKLLFEHGGRARSNDSELGQDTGYYRTSTSLILTKEATPPEDFVTLTYHYLPVPYADEETEGDVESSIEDAYIDAIMKSVIATMLKRRRDLQEAAIYLSEYRVEIRKARRFENARGGFRNVNINE